MPTLVFSSKRKINSDLRGAFLISPLSGELIKIGAWMFETRYNYFFFFQNEDVPNVKGIFLLFFSSDNKILSKLLRAKYPTMRKKKKKSVNACMNTCMLASPFVSFCAHVA